MRKTFKTIILFFVFFIGAGTDFVNAQNPPAHAKAHGVKKKYRYYPDANIYFDPLGKKYTYFSGGRWTTTLHLPTSIRLIGSFNDFDFEGDNPWKENSKHKEKYKVAKPVNHGDVKHVEKALDINSNNGNGKKNKK